MNSDLTYVCREGETFDSVALKLYGDERYACELLAANPALCCFGPSPKGVGHRSARFSGGETLVVPVVVIPEADEAEESGAPMNAPWKER